MATRQSCRWHGTSRTTALLLPQVVGLGREADEKLERDGLDRPSRPGFPDRADLLLGSCQVAGEVKPLDATSIEWSLYPSRAPESALLFATQVGDSFR
jgi:hypothetical protein